MDDENMAKEYGYGAAYLVCSIASLLASIVCMYWFCRMGKRFRHRLVSLAHVDLSVLTSSIQTHHDTHIRRPYAWNLDLRIYRPVLSSRYSRHDSHALPSQRIPSTVWDRNKWSVVLVHSLAKVSTNAVKTMLS